MEFKKLPILGMDERSEYSHSRDGFCESIINLYPSLQGETVIWKRQKIQPDSYAGNVKDFYIWERKQGYSFQITLDIDGDTLSFQPIIIMDGEITSGGSAETISLSANAESFQAVVIANQMTILLSNGTLLYVNIGADGYIEACDTSKLDFSAAYIFSDIDNNASRRIVSLCMRLKNGALLPIAESTTYVSSTIKFIKFGSLPDETQNNLTNFFSQWEIYATPCYSLSDIDKILSSQRYLIGATNDKSKDTIVTPAVITNEEIITYQSYEEDSLSHLIVSPNSIYQVNGRLIALGINYRMINS